MLQRKLTLLLVVTMIFCLYSRSQSAVSIDTNNLKVQATRMAESFLQADYTTFIEYTYSKIVQLMGGKDKMINSLKNEVQKMKDNGVTFTSISVGLTEHIVNAGEEIHALVSQRLIMKVPGGTLAADSYLLAITSNGGTSWSFVDTAPLQNEETIKLIFPNYNMDLKIPPKAKPTFIKTQ